MRKFGAYGPLDEQLRDGDGVGAQFSEIRQRVTTATRVLNVAPPEGTIGFPQLWPANSYEGQLPALLAESLAIDPVRLVSSHDLTVIAGEPCIAGPATLYFEVSAAEDDAELDESAGAYGFRAGRSQNVDLWLRYHGVGTLGVSYLAGSSVPAMLTDSADGDTWAPVVTQYSRSQPHGQTFAATVDGALTSVQLYMKRDAGITNQIARLTLYSVDGSHLPDEVLATVEVDVSAISTTGEWVDFHFDPAPAIEDGTEYAITLFAARYQLADIHWLKDASSPAYAGGSALVGEEGGTWSVDATADYCVTIEQSAQVTMVAAGAAGSYRGWGESSFNLDMVFRHEFNAGDNAADFAIALGENMALSAVGLLDTVTGGFPQWRAGHVRTRHLQAAGGGQGQVLSSLTTNTTQDDLTGSTSYQNCAGAGSITTTETCTIVVQAHARFRTSHQDYQAALRLCDNAGNNIGGITAATTDTTYDDHSFYARLTGQAAGTYSFKLMGQIAHASYHCYVDEKQILITAYPEG